MHNIHEQEERAKFLLNQILGLAIGDLEIPGDENKYYAQGAMLELIQILVGEHSSTIAEHLEWEIFNNSPEWSDAMDAYREKFLSQFKGGNNEGFKK